MWAGGSLARVAVSSARRGVACFLTALLVLTLACGSGDGPGSGGEGPADEAPGASEGSPDGGAGDGEGALVQGDTIFVYMDEYFIDMPLTLPPGDVVFEVRNAGFEEHNFELLRNDSLLYSFEDPLNPAQTRSLEVTLEPGEYDVLCTVSGHEGRGMQEVLTVTEGDGS